jgi:outer membrane lipoprotein-sorting protein
MRHRIRRTRLLAAALAALAACAPPHAPPPDLSLDPAELLAQVKGEQAKVRSVRGEARVRVEGEKLKGAVRELVAAGKPDRLRVDTLDFFGNPVAKLATSGGRFTLYDARARVVYRGAATPRNLSRLVPLPLPADVLVTILCGSAPLIDGRPAAAEPGKGVVVLELAGDGRKQRLEIGEHAAVERSDLDGRGGYALRFEHFRSRPGGRLPNDLVLHSADPSVKLELHWTDVEVNADLEESMFRIDPPRGARVVDLDAGGPDEPPDVYRGAELPGPGG